MTVSKLYLNHVEELRDNDYLGAQSYETAIFVSKKNEVSWKSTTRLQGPRNFSVYRQNQESNEIKAIPTELSSTYFLAGVLISKLSSSYG
ncbi:hypothetical protein PTKIN_Ptkin06aG0143400 [Pterospermum kingtungense]